MGSFIKSIFLLGMPGCGKSTLGKQLAEALGMQFIDLDLFIELETGRPIAQIFKDQGEEHFRNIEGQYLRQLGEQPEAKIVATGGGTPCFQNNMDYINQLGVGVFIDVPVEILTDRLMQQGVVQRPLLHGKTKSELLVHLQQNYLERKPYYLKASVILSGNDISIQDILAELQTL